MRLLPEQRLWGLLRITLGLLLLWAFFDKVFGLGFSTAPASAWLKGGSPTTGFLLHGVHGPLAPLFEQLGGSPIIDWLFMLGLLGIGLALTFGIVMRLATITGVILFGLMYLALFPPAQNPIIDEHLIYILLLLTLNKVQAQKYLGFGS